MISASRKRPVMLEKGKTVFKQFCKIIFLSFLVSACGPATSPVGPTRINPSSNETGLLPTSTPESRVDNQSGVPISPDTAKQVKLLYTLTGHSNRVTDLAFSDDGVYLASSGRDGTIRLWDIRSRQEVDAFPISESDLNVIAFSPDGSLLASSEAIWDVESRQVVHTLDRGMQAPGHVAFSPDGSLLAVAGFHQSFKLWDLASGQVIRTFDEPVGALGFFGIAFSPDGKQIAASGANNGIVTLWDVESGQITRTLAHGDRSDVHDLAFSPDGSLLAGGGTGSAVRIWDVASGEALHRLWLNNGIYGLAFSPDGKILALASCNRAALVYDVESGRMLRALPHPDELMAVAFSPDGALLAAAGYDNRIYLWGIPNSQTIQTLD